MSVVLSLHYTSPSGVEVLAAPIEASLDLAIELLAPHVEELGDSSSEVSDLAHWLYRNPNRPYGETFAGGTLSIVSEV